jgi:nicotinamide riboside transporter PnuC
MNFDVSWLLALFSIMGTVFNIKKKILCFYLWAIGEIFWIALDLHNSQYGRVFLDVVHLGMAVWGIYSWRKEVE